MDTQIESRGSRRTKNLFKEALIQLTQTESYSIITVKEIVNEADYNRSTFYKHYLDKEDLLDDLIQDMVIGLEKVVEGSFKKYAYDEMANLKKQDLKLFNFIYEHRRVFSLWKQSDLSQDLTMRCTQAIYQKLYGIWIANTPDKEHQVESASRIMSYQIMGIIYGWLINGLHTEPTIIADEFIQFYKDQANHK